MAPARRLVDSQILRRAHPVPGGAELVVGEQADDRRNVAGPGPAKNDSRRVQSIVSKISTAPVCLVLLRAPCYSLGSGQRDHDRDQGNEGDQHIGEVGVQPAGLQPLRNRDHGGERPGCGLV